MANTVTSLSCTYWMNHGIGKADCVNRHLICKHTGGVQKSIYAPACTVNASGIFRARWLRISVWTTKQISGYLIGYRNGKLPCTFQIIIKMWPVFCFNTNKTNIQRWEVDGDGFKYEREKGRLLGVLSYVYTQYTTPNKQRDNGRPSTSIQILSINK